MRLGDLDDLYKKFKDTPCDNDDARAHNQIARYYIRHAPTIDPVRAAGGCYCRECRFGRRPCAVDMQDGYVYCQEQSKYKELDSFCSDGELRGEQDNDQ